MGCLALAISAARLLLKVESPEEHPFAPREFKVTLFLGFITLGLVVPEPLTGQSVKCHSDLIISLLEKNLTILLLREIQIHQERSK